MKGRETVLSHKELRSSLEAYVDGMLPPAQEPRRRPLGRIALGLAIAAVASLIGAVAVGAAAGLHVDLPSILPAPSATAAPSPIVSASPSQLATQRPTSKSTPRSTVSSSS